jgi:integral membrane protein
MNRPVRDLRLVGLLEGLSYLLLLFVAMPLKYAAGLPGAVKVVGMIHGILFIAFVALALRAWRTERWPISKLAFALVMSLIPAGTFWLDAVLKRDLAANEKRSRPRAMSVSTD